MEVLASHIFRLLMYTQYIHLSRLQLVTGYNSYMATTLANPSLANKFPDITQIFTKYANKYYKILIPNPPPRWSIQIYDSQLALDEMKLLLSKGFGEDIC